MKKIISYIIIWILTIPFSAIAAEDYLFDSAESSPNAQQISKIKDPKVRYCEQVYLEAMRRRPFTRREVRICRNIFIKKIKAEIEYKRRVMKERNIYN